MENLSVTALGKEGVAKALEETFDKRKQLRRTLTSHVATRFYRAPELILMEKDYSKPVDIWSIGVIMGELLNSIEGNQPPETQRKCLFPGKYCFPLSPNKQSELDEEGIPDTRGDQLEVIFEMIGTPDALETSFITDSKALSYLERFKPQKAVDLKMLYPKSDPQGLDLMKQMLSFNPYFRPTVDECLKHPYFEEVTQFSTAVNANGIVDMELEYKNSLSLA